VRRLHTISETIHFERPASALQVTSFPRKHKLQGIMLGRLCQGCVVETSYVLHSHIADERRDVIEELVTYYSYLVSATIVTPKQMTT